MSSLQGRHALVTGGGRGIGRAIAAALSAAGANVTVVGRTEKSLQEAAAAGDAKGWIVGDVTQPEAVIDNLRVIETVRGPVDILVANAGGADSAPFAETTPDQFRGMFELNVMGVVNTTQAVLGSMIERKFGRVIAIASTAGVKGYGYVSAYCAAKHAVVGLARTLANELGPRNIRVNTVHPGGVATPMIYNEAMAEWSGEHPSFSPSQQPLLNSPPVEPEVISDTMVYLCGASGRFEITSAISAA